MKTHRWVLNAAEIVQ